MDFQNMAYAQQFPLVTLQSIYLLYMDIKLNFFTRYCRKQEEILARKMFFKNRKDRIFFESRQSGFKHRCPFPENARIIFFGNSIGRFFYVVA